MKKLKSRSSLSYLTVTLEFDEPAKSEITKDIFAFIIFTAVKTLHGEVAAAEPLDLLDFDQETLQATVSCTRQSLQNVWSALTLFGTYNGQRCLFHIDQIASPRLEKGMQEGQGTATE